MSKTENTTASENWTEVITPRSSLLQLRLGEVWRYKDLLLLFVRRDFVAIYKQTILGPLWIFLQPLLTSITYVIIFSRVAHLSSDGVPPILFYLAGVTCWNYFSTCLNNTSNTFIGNAAIFGKVYFPRLIMPLSIVLSNLIKFLVQFLLFIAFLVYYYYSGAAINPNLYIFLLPILLIMMAGMGLGFGMIISSLTTKYRDLIYLLTFGVQLWMYASPVIYPLNSLHGKLKELAMLNPLSGVIEAFKYAFLGRGVVSWKLLSYDMGFMVVILMLGVIIFNKVEKSFMDTV